MDFCLGGMQDEGESKVLPPSRRQPKRRVVTFEEIAKAKRTKGFCLSEDNQGGESKVLPPSRRQLRKRLQKVTVFEDIAMQERVRYYRIRRDSKQGESKGLPLLRRQSNRREQSVVAFVRYKGSACESKEKQERFFISRETYTINFVFLLVIILFGT